MKSGADWYKREPVAYLGGVQGLTAREHAVYSVVLDLIYLHGGSVNNDPGWIAGWISDMGAQAVRTAIASLVSRGKIQVDGDQLTQKRAKTQAKTRENLKETMRELGEKGGKKSAEIRRDDKENKELDEPCASTREDKIREDIVGGGNAGARDPDPPEPPPASQPDPQDKTSERELLLLSMHCDPTGLTGPNGKIIGTLADMRHVQRWKQDLGLSLQDILTVVAEVMATKREPGPPSSFRYFEQAMCRAAGASEPIQPQQNGDQDGQPQSPYQTGKRTGVDRPASGQRRASEGLVSGFSRALSDINR